MSHPALWVAALLAATLLAAVLVAAVYRAPRLRPTSHRPSARPANKQPAWQPRSIRSIHEDPPTAPIPVVGRGRHAVQRPARFLPGKVGVTSLYTFGPLRSNGDAS